MRTRGTPPKPKFPVEGDLLMFKKIAKSIAVCLLVAVLAAGCASLNKPSDEDMIQSTLNNVKLALETKDVEALMLSFSEGFEHPQVGGKEDLHKMLKLGLESGYADKGEVKIDQVKLTFSDDKKSVAIYPMDLSSSQGSVSVELVLAKEEAGWLVKTVNVDGV